MPLYIGGVLVGDEVDCKPRNIFQTYPNLHTTSVQFIKENLPNTKTLDEKTQRILYVGQREYAVIAKNLNKCSFDYIVTDEATTCHILVFIEPSTGTVGLAHLDGGGNMQESIKEFISTINCCQNLIDNDGSPAVCKNLEMYLFGGFVDAKGYSEPMFDEILSTCKNLDQKIELKLACCFSVNNVFKANENYPLITGLGVRVESLDVSVIKCRNIGPDTLLRNVRMIYNNEETTMKNIYDFHEGCVYIEPFSFHKARYAHELLRLPDAVYLKYCSTSPHCESEYFVEHSKSVIRFTLRYHDCVDSIFQGKTRKCYLDEHNKWLYKDACHSQIKL